jgi:hypothetical protein
MLKRYSAPPPKSFPRSMADAGCGPEPSPSMPPDNCGRCLNTQRGPRRTRSMRTLGYFNMERVACQGPPSAETLVPCKKARAFRWASPLMQFPRYSDNATSYICHLCWTPSSPHPKPTLARSHPGDPRPCARIPTADSWGEAVPEHLPPPPWSGPSGPGSVVLLTRRRPDSTSRATRPPVFLPTIPR